MHNKLEGKTVGKELFPRLPRRGKREKRGKAG